MTVTVIDAPTSRWPIVLIAGSLLIGLAVRGYVVVQPPASSTRWDHHEYVRWGVLMHEEGFAALYDHPPRETLMWNHRRSRAEIAHHPEFYVCNYPPLAAYALYAQIKALHLFDPTLTSNTTAARIIYALLSGIGDCLVAAGCCALVRRLASRLAGAIAFAVIMLIPPFIIDSARWTQTDSWVLAPLVWTLWAMLTQRWLRAGLLWGVAMGLKTQGILFAPVWVFAFLLGPRRRRIVAAGLLALVVLFASALPFTVHSGLKWFEEAYAGNVLKMYKVTTLKAFNLWYVDLLLCDDLDAGAKLLGVAKDVWGKVLLSAVLLGSAVLIFRKRHAYPAVLLTFAAVSLLAVVIFPTRVHERYIILPIPFLVVAAMWHRRLWIPLVPFLIAASFQMTALDWLGRGHGAGSWPDMLAWNQSQQLERLTEEYEGLRAALPAEEFAALPPPEKYLERVCRAEYLEERAQFAPKEWVLTTVELLFAGALFVLLLFPPGKPPSANPGGMAKDRPR